jgi:hypothetical protein
MKAMVTGTFRYGIDKALLGALFSTLSTFTPSFRKKKMLINLA